MPEALTRGAKAVSRYSAIALGASFPISTALDNVLLLVLLIAWAVSGASSETIKKTFKNKCLTTPLLLFAALAIGMAYGQTPWREAMSVLGKYVDLLFIPIIAVALRDDAARRTALYAFAASIALTVVLSWLLWLRVLPSWPIFVWDQISPSVFKYKATHNILVAFGVFVFVWLARDTQNQWWKKVLYAFAVLSAGNVVLLINGATGHVILAAMAALYVMQRLSGKQAAIAACAVMALGAVLLSVPGALHDRVAVIAKELRTPQAGGVPTHDESSSARVQMYRNTLDIIIAQPLTGVGTGGFTTAYAKQVEGTTQERTTNPHNEFLLITVQLGITGLALMLLLYWTQWRAAGELKTPIMRGLAQGLVITMVIACAVNSMLLDHTEGLFYAWFSGVLFGGIKYQADKSVSSLV